MNPNSFVSASGGELRAANDPVCETDAPKAECVRASRVAQSGTRLRVAFCAAWLFLPGALHAQANFGARLGQHINLWSTQYAIGVQDRTVYFRTGRSLGHFRGPADYVRGDGFAWYAGGSHTDNLIDNLVDPGPGGSMLMTLDYVNDGHYSSTQNQSSPGARLYVNGYAYADSWYTTSDRNKKTGFKPISATGILDRVLSLTITQWALTNAPSIQHLSPMAQDFHAAFGLGMDETNINLGDEGGVALAAIQGLNQKLEASLKEQQARIAELEKKAACLDELEKTVHDLKSLLPEFLSSKSGGDR